MKQSVRWALTISSDLDRRVRRHLEAIGRKGHLADFVEETLRARMLELKMNSAPAQRGASANDAETASPLRLDEPVKAHCGK